MSYFIGPTGATGIVGPQGLQGRQGPVGQAFGFTGPNFTYYGSGAKLQIYSPPSGSPITLTSTYPSAFYNLFNSSAFGTTNVILPPTSISYPLPEQTGMFWWFKNNTPSPNTLTLTFSGDKAPPSFTISSTGRMKLILIVDANGNASYLTIK